MNLFRGCSSLCAAALMGALIATPAAFADLPGPAAGDRQVGQQLVSDITVLTGLNRMRLTQGQMRDIVQRLSQFSHAEETYAEHETNTSQTALAAMREVEKALQAGQAVDPAAQAKVDAVLNPLKAEDAKVEQLRDETINAIEKELRPEQLAALADTLGISGPQARTMRFLRTQQIPPQDLMFGARPDNVLTDPNAGVPGGADAIPELGQPLKDVGPLEVVPLEKDGAPDAVKDRGRVEKDRFDEDGLTGPPAAQKPGDYSLDGGRADMDLKTGQAPMGAATPAPAAAAPNNPASVVTTAPIQYGDLVRQDTVTPLAGGVHNSIVLTDTAAAPAANLNTQLQEDEGKLPPIDTGFAFVKEDPGQAQQQAEVADLEQRLQKLNAQTLDALKMIQKTMAKLHRGRANPLPVQMVETPDGNPRLALPGVTLYAPAIDGRGYAFGGGFAIQGGPYDEAVRRFFLQPNVLRFLKARLANQE